jgi:hypothetical protein
MRDPAKTFEDLAVWQKAHQFMLAVYRLSRTFPRSETYGLSSQFRRAKKELIRGGLWTNPGSLQTGLFRSIDLQYSGGGYFNGKR